MPRFSMFLVEVGSDGKLIPRTGLTGVFLQPQPDIGSANPSTMSPNADSITLSESVTNPGQYYADITKPVPRYDFYIANSKQADFSGTAGFEMPASKSIYFKRGVILDSTALTVPEIFTTGVGKLATPDGGQTFPKFSGTNLPYIAVLPPSELLGGYYAFRITKLVRNSISVNGSGQLVFSLSLDPNGVDLANYYFDLLIIMP